MLWIVGHAFKDVRDYLAARDIAFGVLVQSDQPIPTALKDVENIVPLDFSSSVRLIESAEAATLAVSGILTAGYENYVLPAAVLANHYEVPGLTLAAAQATTDKSIMRTAFAAHDTTISPGFQKVANWGDIESFMANHSFPVMLKPTNLMKSLFITKSSTTDELRRNFEQIQAGLSGHSDKIYTLYPSEIIIEEFMNGSMHTVAGFADADGRAHVFPEIVDCVSGRDAGLSGNYIYSRQLPTRLSRPEVNDLLHVAQAGVAALGLTNTMLHIEIILTPDGPKIIEIGARIGGYRTRMYEYASSIDLNGIMIDLALGKTFQALVPKVRRSIAVIELFPEVEGRFDAVACESKLTNLPSLRYYSLKSAVGSPIGRSSHGYKAAGVVILGHDHPEQFTADFNFVRQHVRIKTVPN